MNSYLTLENLEQNFLGASEQDAKFIGVQIMRPSGLTEIIIFESDSFDEKLAYYKTAYTNTLQLKTNPAIAIVGFTYADSLSCVAEDLLGIGQLLGEE